MNPSAPIAPKEGQQSPVVNPFNTDLVAAFDSPRYSGSEHRIAFADEGKCIEGTVYGKTLALTIARAAFVTEACNTHARLLGRCAELEIALKRAAELLEDVRTGEDFEAVCWDHAEKCRAALALKPEGKQP